MLLFVVNGAAGGGRGAKIWRAAQDELKLRGVRYETVEAAAGAEACAAVRARIEAGVGGTREAVRAVAVIGGDGTVHAVLPALAGGGVPLAVIPAGSGNDTARTFRLSADPAAALDRIQTGVTRTLDLIDVQTHSADGAAVSYAPALASVACGFDADVAEAVNRAAYKRWCNRLRIGSAAYVVGVVDRLRTYRPQPVSVTVDGSKYRFNACWMAAVANIPSYGGGLRICPDAEPGDGLLDLCVVHSCSPARLLRLFPTLLAGTHVKQPIVTLLRGARIELRAPDGPGLPAALDGEPIEAARALTVKVSPQGLRLIL